MSRNDASSGTQPVADREITVATRADSDGSDGEDDDTAAVVLEDVRRTYVLGEPVHALDGVSLVVPEGSYTAVMGPSGSGKSTLMNLVGCLDTATDGVVTVGGRDVGTLSAAGKAKLRGEEVGFVFQTFNLMGRLTAAENVALPMVFRGRSRSERADRARDLLADVGLGDRVEHTPTELSGGQRQRVAIARALANEPRLLLADEPTGNLDTETGASIMAVFAALHDAGNTVLVVTHERPIAEHADRIVHLRDGRIEEIETVAEPRRGDDAGIRADASETDGGADTRETDSGADTHEVDSGATE